MNNTTITLWDDWSQSSVISGARDCAAYIALRGQGDLQVTDQAGRRLSRDQRKQFNALVVAAKAAATLSPNAAGQAQDIVRETWEEFGGFPRELTVYSYDRQPITLNQQEYTLLIAVQCMRERVAA